MSHKASSRDGIVSHKASSRDGIVSRKVLNHMISVAAPNLAQPSIKLIFLANSRRLSPALKKIKYFIVLYYFLKVYHNTE